jgi:hypothetical protein
MAATPSKHQNQPAITFPSVSTSPTNCPSGKRPMLALAETNKHIDFIDLLISFRETDGLAQKPL